MKATLEFILPEEAELFEYAKNGLKYKVAIDEIWNCIFRPAFKHGYTNEALNELLKSPIAQQTIAELAEIYKQVLAENGVEW